MKAGAEREGVRSREVEKRPDPVKEGARRVGSCGETRGEEREGVREDPPKRLPLPDRPPERPKREEPRELPVEGVRANPPEEPRVRGAAREGPPPPPPRLPKRPGSEPPPLASAAAGSSSESMASAAKTLVVLMGASRGGISLPRPIVRKGRAKGREGHPPFPRWEAPGASTILMR